MCMSVCVGEALLVSARARLCVLARMCVCVCLCGRTAFVRALAMVAESGEPRTLKMTDSWSDLPPPRPRVSGDTGDTEAQRSSSSSSSSSSTNNEYRFPATQVKYE